MEPAHEEVLELFELSDSKDNVFSKGAGDSGKGTFQFCGVCKGVWIGEFKAESEMAAGILDNSDRANKGLSSFESRESKLLFSMNSWGRGSSVPSSATSTARRGSGSGAKRIRRGVGAEDVAIQRSESKTINNREFRDQGNAQIQKLKLWRKHHKKKNSLCEASNS